jgi:hypothetical protein
MVPPAQMQIEGHQFQLSFDLTQSFASVEILTCVNVYLSFINFNPTR